MKLNLKAVEERVAPLGGRQSYDREFIFGLLLAYGRSRSNVTRLRNGSLNVAADPETEVAQKGVVYFKETSSDPLAVIDELKTSPTVVRYRPRFVIVTDWVELLAVDTKTEQNIAIPIADIDQHFTFFLPWAGMEKAQYVAEAIADVKAAEKMGKLFDELLAVNPQILSDPYGRHSLNVFFTRLLFCFFAEDTGIFGANQFTNAVGSHTQADGSDVADFLTDLFVALDTPNASDKLAHLREFPYVNGRLFTVAAEHTVPGFTKRARELLIELGTLVWREINPDIFGSMFQAVVTPVKRSDLGQHYTSVPNILKTIEPLFLNGLQDEFDSAYDSARKLESLLERISKIKVFDPACGSGNFLIIAYKELRRLEHAILERLTEIDNRHQVLWAESKINIEHFYGVELDDFAVEVAILSLWIAKHQMNAEFKEKFNLSIPLIPLKETGQIRAANASRVDWRGVCPNNGSEEIYLIGNPPYAGSSMQSRDQKADFAAVFGGQPYAKALDYISLWFVKGAEYIQGTKAELAFVSTNSITQGEQVGMLFPAIFAAGVEIGFAYTSFKWANNAKYNAAVKVVVIGLRSVRPGPKTVYADGLEVQASNINAYLTDGDNIFIEKRSNPISAGLPSMLYGSKPTDGGNLTLEPHERDLLLEVVPESARFIKKLLGSTEFIHGKERYCLWIEDADVNEAFALLPIAQRLERTAAMRSSSAKLPTQKLASTPHRFGEVRYRGTEAIIIPAHSSGERAYIPMGYLGNDAIISNAAFAVYGAEPWLFALLNSRMHMTWVAALAGRMGTDYRYSNTILYNTFPVPVLGRDEKERLAEAAFRVLDVREYHCQKTLGELYDAELMPAELRAAHAEVDALVDSLYSKKAYEADEQRLSDLFAMYEAMAADEAPEGTKK